jgi:hypothetical protein
MSVVKITLVGGVMARRRRLRVLAPREYKKTRMLRLTEDPRTLEDSDAIDAITDADAIDAITDADAIDAITDADAIDAITDAGPTAADPKPTAGANLKDYEIQVKSMELDATGKVLNINVKESENRAGANLHFRITDYAVFQSREDKMMYLQKLDLDIDDISIFQSGMEEFLNTFFGELGKALQVIMAFCLFIVPPLGIDIIKLFQMLDYLLFFNIEPPTNLKAFLTLFSSTPLDLFPNPFQTMGDEKHGCTPPRKFEENDMTCYILNNNGGYILQ